LEFETTWKLQQLEGLISQLNPSSNIDDPIEIQNDVLSQAIPTDVSIAVSYACKAFLYVYTGIRRTGSAKSCGTGLVVSVESELPPGAGLGSSAAFSTSLTAALLAFLRTEPSSQDVISRWAFKCEHVFHGKPSGIDNSICTFGGAVLFREGKVVEHLTSFQKMNALLVYTNVTRNTKTLVEGVTRKREKYSQVVHHTMEAIDSISCNAWELIKQGKYTGLERQELVEMNQYLVNLLGAGHETIDKVLGIAKKHGQTGKLTGAGGGGCVILHMNPGIFIKSFILH